MQAFPKLTLGSAAMYDTAWWRALVTAWEVVVYNPILDLERWWFVVLLACVAGAAVWRRRGGGLWRKQQQGGRDLSV